MQAKWIGLICTHNVRNGHDATDTVRVHEKLDSSKSLLQCNYINYHAAYHQYAILCFPGTANNVHYTLGSQIGKKCSHSRCHITTRKTEWVIVLRWQSLQPLYT